MPRIAAVIQARTGSTRLPGKVFREIAGHPLLFHVLERLAACESLQGVILATTESHDDRAILDFAAEHGVLSFAGSEDDVQARFIGAAEAHGVEILVRICSDSPFIDPAMIDRLVREVDRRQAEYGWVDPSQPSAQEGFEVVTLEALKKSRNLSASTPHREHVTLHIRENRILFRVVELAPEPELLGRFRLSVDNYADLEFTRAIYRELYRPAWIVDLKAMVRLVKEHPEISALNAHVHQKNTRASSRKIAVVLAGNRKPEAVARLESIGRALIEHHHCGIRILHLKGYDDSLDRFRELGMTVIETDEAHLADAIADSKADAVIYDGDTPSGIALPSVSLYDTDQALLAMAQ